MNIGRCPATSFWAPPRRKHGGHEHFTMLLMSSSTNAAAPDFVEKEQKKELSFQILIDLREDLQ